MPKLADWIRHFSRHATVPTDPLARRRFLNQAIWTATGIGLAAGSPRAARAQTAPAPIRFVAEPFTLGVASGYPHAHGFTLWTRLAPAPALPHGGMSDDRIVVRCEVANDDAFKSIVQTMTCDTAPETVHSVHLDIDGLAPGRTYFYRFLSGDAVSPTGRTHTLPEIGGRVDRQRIVIASCQNFEHGYFSAYRQMQRDAPDLVLFLGDYIYENQWGDRPVRRHLGGEAMTLSGYRTRHAQYKCDPDLQAMHRAAPWAFAWDDHEVDNDYANDQSEWPDTHFLLRRAAAYQAFFEHMPVPRKMFPRGPEMRIYTHFDIGDLLRVYMLDDRQYRSAQGCPSPNKHGSRVTVGCTELREPGRTLLGTEQERWLGAAFKDSRAHWNLIGQQTLFSPMDEQPGPERGAFTDSWDGYPAARERLLADLAAARLKNPVIAGADLHCGVVAAVPGDPERFASKPVASEFLATSLSADARPPIYYDERRAENPHINQMRSDQRGYTLLDFDRQQLNATLQVVSDVRVREPEFAVQARYVVADGRPGPQIA